MKYDFDLEDRRLKRRRIVRQLLFWVLSVAAVVALAYVIVNYGMEKVKVAGNSMKGTLLDGDKVLINKFAYRLVQPERFDVIVYKQSGKEHSYYSVKRVLGLPGETVQIIDGEVYINGKRIKEKIKVDKMENGGLALDEITLDDNEFFVLGDNRNDSEDSRFASIGNIVGDEIIGEAWIRMNSLAFVKYLGT